MKATMATTTVTQIGTLWFAAVQYDGREYPIREGGRVARFSTEAAALAAGRREVAELNGP